MISTLTLSEFRNHESSRIKAGAAKAVIITGPNGSGKTSILEALSVFSSNGTMRGAAMPEILRIGARGGGFGVVAELPDGTNLSVSWSDGDSWRRARVDGDAAALSALPRHLRMVWLTPREDRLFMDAASDRRAFFDRLVAAFDPAHAGRAARLAKLLSERAFAMKSGAAGEWLAPIEKQLAETAVSVAAARVKYVGEINWFLNSYESAERRAQISSKIEVDSCDKSSSPCALRSHNYVITISGMLEEKLSNGALASDVEREYLEYLSRERALVSDKMTIDGAHRADFGMFNRALDMRAAQTSTGQQKSALLSLILAHAKLVRARTGARPLILLDEAAAHLDESARAALFDALSKADAQVWATGIDPALFAGVSDAIFIGCDNGRIVYNSP